MCNVADTAGTYKADKETSEQKYKNNYQWKQSVEQKCNPNEDQVIHAHNQFDLCMSSMKINTN